MRTCVWFGILLAFVAVPGWPYGDPREAMDRAVGLIESQQQTFARVVLEPVLIHPGLRSDERSKAYYLSGFSFLEQGYVVSARKDFNRALEFNEANAAVLVALGNLHANGLGTAQNPFLAFHMFSKASDLGAVQGHLFAGRAHLLGEGTHFDVLQARTLLERAAEAGRSEAMLLLGASYRAPYADPAQPALARGWYERARNAGEVAAIVALGHMVQQGEGRDADAELACAQFEAAADAGSAAGHASFAHCLLSGRGAAKDLTGARRHFERAAAGGDVAGFLGLGYLFEAGEGVGANADRALRFYERAAGAGSARGQYDAGRLHLARGTVEGEAEALRWFGEAASAHVGAANAYAWILATSNHEEHRNGERAVQFATYVVAEEASADHLDTLAAAYAEVGRWEDAVETQVQALAVAGSDHAEHERRLRRYRERQPWRE